MITIENYQAKTKDTDISKLPEVLKAGHQYLIENQDLYGEDADIDKAIDTHIKLMNEAIYKTKKPGRDRKQSKIVKKMLKQRSKQAVKDLKKPLTCPPVDEKGEARIDNEGLELLKECINKEPNTKSLNYKDGQYTKERQKLHDDIINEFKENKPCIVHQAPIAILTGGPPGSGKSHFLKKFAKWITSGKLYHIDADEVRSKLPEYKGWNADNTHAETKDIVNRLISEIGSSCRYDLIYDGTMNRADNYLPLIERLHKLGYKVFVIYMQVPEEVSIKRAMERYQRTGRYVPISVIKEVFEKGLEGFEKVIKHADGYIRVNGETGTITEAGGIGIPKDREYSFKYEKVSEETDTKESKEQEAQPTDKVDNSKAKFTHEEKHLAEEASKAILEILTKGSKHLTTREILTIAQDFNAKHRSLYSQFIDQKKDAKKRISPTVENLIRWLKHPSQFDMIGVDNWKRDDPTADLKIKKEVFWHRLGINNKK